VGCLAIGLVAIQKLDAVSRRDAQCDVPGTGGGRFTNAQTGLGVRHAARVVYRRHARHQFDITASRLESEVRPIAGAPNIHRAV